MNTAALLAADLAAAIITAAAWLGAGFLAVEQREAAHRLRARLTLGAIAAGLLAMAGLWWIALSLANHGWWFAQEKLSFALPVLSFHALLAVVYSVRPLWNAASGRSSAGLKPLVPTVLIGAAAAAVAGLAARMLVGYPLELAPALVLYVLLLLAMMLSYAILSRKGARAVGSLAGFSAFVVIGSLAVVWLGPAMPAASGGHGHSVAQKADAAGISLTDLPLDSSGASGAVRTFELIAAKYTLALSAGSSLDAWAYGSVPGPELRVTQGDRVKVTLRNTDIADGVTIHWHGYDVPNQMDGVAGVTQNAVRPGETFSYDFIARDTGTYWYHTHQISSEGVRRGLYGMFVVLPVGGVAETTDLSVPVHTLSGTLLLGSSHAPRTQTVAAGSSVRLRLVNTDQQPHRLRLAGAPFRIVAVDGRELAEPGEVTGRPVRIPAGGRVDAVLRMPAGQVTLYADAKPAVSLTLMPAGSSQLSAAPPDLPRSDAADVDLLSYGKPTPAVLPKGRGLVEATFVLDRLPRIVSGAPGYGYVVNGNVYPHIPSIEVGTGDVVRLTVANRGWETHPMHVHGHHVLVLARNGVPATGSPLWLDTFDVQPGEVWVVALVADNPGVWMDHCHNLEHAANGMMMTLTYRGVTSPFSHGGDHGNRPE